jgi:hypothetical protein
VHEDDGGFRFHVDHIVSRKHGGLSVFQNLAYACTYCNVFKGSDIAGVDSSSGYAVRLFDPRVDLWVDHFSIRGSRILGITPVGSVTVRLLKLNSEDRVLERDVLQSLNRYPVGTEDI